MASKEPNHFNQLLKSYKLLYSSLSHADAQGRVKAYYDTIKNGSNLNEVVRDKIQSWERLRIKWNGEKFSSWCNASNPGSKKRKTSDNSGILEIWEEHHDSNLPSSDSPASSSTKTLATNSATTSICATTFTNAASSCSNDISSEALYTSTTETAPQQPPAPPAPKRRYAEEHLSTQILALTDDIHKLEEVIELNIMSNPLEQKEIIKSKKEALAKLVKKKHKLHINRTNQKRTRERKKVKKMDNSNKAD